MIELLRNSMFLLAELPGTDADISKVFMASSPDLKETRIVDLRAKSRRGYIMVKLPTPRVLHLPLCLRRTKARALNESVRTVVKLGTSRRTRSANPTLPPPALSLFQIFVVMYPRRSSD